MISFLQPFIPHYRQDFFNELNKSCPLKVYCYENQDEVANNNFHSSSTPYLKVKSLSWKGFLIYNPFSLLKKEYSAMVLMLHFGHLTTWILLLTKFLHRKKIILWGHGISVKRYLKEERKPDPLLKLMIYLADSVWFYTEYELKLWKQTFPQLQAIALGNTISGIDDILSLPPQDKALLKQKYSISQETVFIYCARFNTHYRRQDLLLEIIEKANPTQNAFIIIGDGKLKPDFSRFPNVFDFGSVYDIKLKNELFSISDIYLQPGWVGLSIVEGMAYGKPVFTFRRSSSTLQCVEYSYIEENFNGKIVDTIEDFNQMLKSINRQEIKQMGENAKDYIVTKLRMEHMVDNALMALTHIQN